MTTGSLDTIKQLEAVFEFNTDSTGEFIWEDDTDALSVNVSVIHDTIKRIVLEKHPGFENAIHFGKFPKYPPPGQAEAWKLLWSKIKAIYQFTEKDLGFARKAIIERFEVKEDIKVLQYKQSVKKEPIATAKPPVIPQKRKPTRTAKNASTSAKSPPPPPPPAPSSPPVPFPASSSPAAASASPYVFDHKSVDFFGKQEVRGDRIPTHDDANEFIWFYDLEVHNGWPARAICQITAVRADGKAAIDEYVFYRPLHRSYQDVMTMSRLVHSANVGPLDTVPKLIQLSPWDDPSIAKPLHDVMLKWLQIMHDNSVCIFMGSTDPGVIMMNLYEQVGLSGTEGLLQLMRTKAIWSAKYLDVRKYIYTRFPSYTTAKQANQIAPPGSLAKVHNTLFIGTLKHDEMAINAAMKLQFQDADDWLQDEAFVVTEKKSQIKIEYHKATPVWHTAHTDSLVLRNVIAALLFVANSWVNPGDGPAERTDVDQFAKLALRHLTLSSVAFSKKLMTIPSFAAASLYAFLVYKLFIPMRSQDPSAVIDMKDKKNKGAKGMSRLPTASLLYLAPRAQKAAASEDFKEKHFTQEEMDAMEDARLAATFDPTEIDSALSLSLRTRAGAHRIRARQHNKDARVNIISKRREGKLRKQALEEMFKAMFPAKHSAEDLGLIAALKSAADTRIFRDAIDLMKDYLVDPDLGNRVRDWPIYYFSRRTDKKTSIVLHNRFCHLLYDIDYSKRNEDLYFERRPKLGLELQVYVPTDQTFCLHTPVFCKQCKRYVNDTDPAIPRLLQLQREIDETWSWNLHPIKWNAETHAISVSGVNYNLPTWPLSNVDPKIATEIEEVAVDIANSRPTIPDEEDSELEINMSAESIEEAESVSFNSVVPGLVPDADESAPPPPPLVSGEPLFSKKCSSFLDLLPASFKDQIKSIQL